jgi:GT2 family glycosyltransferase
MTLAIILPVYNHLEYTKITLNELSVKLSSVGDGSFQIILIDDGSSDGTSDWVSLNFSKVHILKGDGNLWWSGAVNKGAKYAFEELKADYILLWNNDITIEKNYFQTLISLLKENNHDTIIGSKILVSGQSDVIWSMGGYFNPKTGKYGMYGYFEPDSDKYKDIMHADWLTGMGTIIPKQAVDKVGYWDNQNFPQYHGDSDFTYRAKLNGFKVIVVPSLIMYNVVENSGIEHKGSFKILLRLLTDIRSKSNLKKNFTFYHRYATSFLAYLPLIWHYIKIFGGFFKWKFLALFNLRKK